MRYCFIDRVKELALHKSIAVSKAVSYGEPFLEDHFPGAPVLPGAMMVEGAIEAAMWLLRVSKDFLLEDFDVVKVKQAKFSKVVAPGDVLVTTVEVDSKNSNDELTWFRCKGKCDDRKAFSVRFALKSVIMEVLPENKDYFDIVSKRQKVLWSVLTASMKAS